MKYSLKEDLRLLDLIENNIKQRGSELEIKSRMRKSIYHCCENTNLSVDEIRNFSKRSWIYNTIFDRFKKIGKENIYKTTYAMCSHSIHGRWSDILMFNLKEEDGLYKINLNFKEPTIKIIMPIAFYLSDVLQ